MNFILEIVLSIMNFFNLSTEYKRLTDLFSRALLFGFASLIRCSICALLDPKQSSPHQCWGVSTGGKSEPLVPASGDLKARDINSDGKRERDNEFALSR